MPLNKDVGNWIKDFMKSNAPQFKGKSKEERKDMALAAYREKYGSLNEQDDRVMNEERKLTYDDFVQMVRADMNAGAASDEYVSDERVRRDAKWKYNEYLQGVSLDDLFLYEATKEEKGATAAEEDKFHRDLDKLVHKTFGHSSDEKKEMKEGTTGIDYMKIIDLVKSADNPQNLSIYYNSDHNKVNIGGVGYDKGDLVKMFNLEPGQSSDVKALFYKANQNAEDVVNAINNEKAGVKAQLKYGYGKEPFVTYKMVNSLDEKAKPDFLDIDKDGNTEEPMKKAAKDAKKEAVEKAMKKVSEVIKVKTPEEAAKISKENPEADIEVVEEGDHYDYEGKMAHSQLLSIVKNSRDLFNMIGEDDQLKAWVQSKLTKAEDYLDAVKTYLDGKELSNSIHEDKK